MPIRLNSRMIATLIGAKCCSSPKVEHHDHADEDFEDEDELALRDQVGLAGLVDQLGDLEHRPMHRQILELCVNHETEGEAEKTDTKAAHQQRPGVHASKADGPEIRQAPGWLRRRPDGRLLAGPSLRQAPAGPPAQPDPQPPSAHRRMAARIPARAPREQNVSNMSLLLITRGASPLGLPYTLSREPLRRLAPFAWLLR